MHKDIPKEVREKIKDVEGIIDKNKRINEEVAKEIQGLFERELGPFGTVVLPTAYWKATADAICLVTKKYEEGILDVPSVLLHCTQLIKMLKEWNVSCKAGNIYT